MTRFLMTLALFAIAAYFAYSMLRGWRARARRQERTLPPFPRVPADLSGARAAETMPVVTGVYVGTTIAGDWQDRVTIGDIGHRAEGSLRLCAAGLQIERVGAGPLWIPAESLCGARVAMGLAGKVMPGPGLLVITWRLGAHLLDSGFRADDRDVYPDWVEALRALCPAPVDSRGEGQS